MTRRRLGILRDAKLRLAAELGMTVEAMERQAQRMAKATKELGRNVAKLKLERHGMKLTQVEELAIARVHQTLTIAMADLKRIEASLDGIVFDSMHRSVIIDAIQCARRHCESARPERLCERCHRGEAMPRCSLCHGRGWV